MGTSRRDFIRAGLAAAGGLALARPLGALARPLGLTPAVSTSRASKLVPGTLLVHADLHNHSLHSDGDGDPALAFASLRAAGLDVAALTDHSTLSWGLPASLCPDSDCQSVAGINEQTWLEAAAFADAANVPGEFVAIRGFEWSSPTIGHMNVWFSERWTDPLHTAGAGSGEGAAQFAHDEGPFPADLMAPLDEIVRGTPSMGVGMAPFYEWLAASPERPVRSGGADGLASFNHPGREQGRFSNFQRVGLPAPPNVIGLEIFNRREDYLFEGTDSIVDSPLNQCLNAGWQVGLSGVTDEHGDDWGDPLGKGRTGLWVTELTRAGVAEALANRRFFATRERGLRLDATANGVRMGSVLGHTAGPITFAVDLESSSMVGTPLQIQVLRSGDRLPSIQATVPFIAPGPEDPPIEFSLPIDAADGDWVVLRITDPNDAPDGRATGDWAAAGRALAYASPFFLS